MNECSLTCGAKLLSFSLLYKYINIRIQEPELFLRV